MSEEQPKKESLRAIIAREIKARQDAVAAILALPPEVQRIVKRQLAQYVRDEKRREADAINDNGVSAQIEYLAEDSAAFPSECWAEMIEAAKREVQG